MLITSSLSKMGSFNADETWFIVRSVGKVKLGNMIHMPDLSPSLDLFFWYQKQKKANLPWWTEYKQRFEHDMHTNQQMIDSLALLEQKAKEKNILLVCFCADVNMCHRGLIADEMQKRQVLVSRQ